MKIKKEIQSLGMPWEEEYGYAQAVKVGDTVWISGQLGHNDEGVLATGMEAQIQQCYSNIKKLLTGFNLTMDNVTEEVLYVLDMNSGFAARKKFGREFYPEPMEIANTIVGVTELALPGQVIEIKIVAKER